MFGNWISIFCSGKKDFVRMNMGQVGCFYPDVVDIEDYKEFSIVFVCCANSIRVEFVSMKDLLAAIERVNEVIWRKG